MSKVKKIWLIIASWASACLIVGVLISGVALATVNFDFRKLSTAPLREEQKYSVNAADIKNIAFTDQNNAVKVIKSSGDKIEVTYFESKLDRYKIEKTDGRLNINAVNERKWFQYISAINGLDLWLQNTTVIISIPENVLETLDIKTSNASITMDNVHVEKSLRAETSNGSVNLSNVQSDADVEIQTSNASLILESLKNNSLRAKTSNGSIRAKNIESRSMIDLKSSNASIEAGALICEGSLNLTTSNGKIRIDKLSAKEINLKTSNSTITGTVAGKISEYSIESRTSNAKNNLPEKLDLGDRRLTVKTSNGRIEITFEE